jgi:hypothetical protein
MANPTPSDAHVDAALTQISTAFLNQPSAFVADKIFPIVPVSKQSDAYFKYDRGDMLRSEAQLRGPGTESAGAGYRLSTGTYYAPVYAVHMDVSDQMRGNADAAINADRDATQYVTQQVLIKRDELWATSFFATSVWTGSTTGADITPGTLWSAANSTPIEDIAEQSESVISKTAVRPNKLIVGAQVHRVLMNHPDVLDRIKYTQTGVVTEDLLAGLFGVDQYVVSRAIKTTSAEGAATTTTDFVFDKQDALLVYANPTPSLMQPSGGYLFSWNGLLGAGAMGNRIKRFRMEHLASDRIEAEMAFASEIVAPECGAFFNEVVS